MLRWSVRGARTGICGRKNGDAFSSNKCGSPRCRAGDDAPVLPPSSPSGSRRRIILIPHARTSPRLLSRTLHQPQDLRRDVIVKHPVIQISKCQPRKVSDGSVRHHDSADSFSSAEKACCVSTISIGGRSSSSASYSTRVQPVSAWRALTRLWHSQMSSSVGMPRIRATMISPTSSTQSWEVGFMDGY